MPQYIVLSNEKNKPLILLAFHERERKHAVESHYDNED
jgi:hypothetical protein